MTKTAIAAASGFVMVEINQPSARLSGDITAATQRLLGGGSLLEVAEALKNDPRQNGQEFAKEFGRFTNVLKGKGLAVHDVGIQTITASRQAGTNNEFTAQLVLSNHKKIPVSLDELRGLTKIAQDNNREQIKTQIGNFIASKTAPNR